jgi:maltokinase
MTVKRAEQLWVDDSRGHALWHVLLLVGPECYQLVIGERPADERAEFLHGREESVVGASRGSTYYDATVDPDLVRHLLEAASGGRETATLVRPVSAEQSNTSLVFDDRLIFKLFRRLRPGSNPEVEVTTALAEGGFAHVAEPKVEWRDDEYDLGYGQQYLSGGTDGWALAITSLRDLFDSEGLGDPAEAGGDFAAEAERLGRVTAEMHIALTSVFGVAPAESALVPWRALVEGFDARLRKAGEHAGRDLATAASPLLTRLAQVTDPGPSTRVHGDFHLGQVMRTDSGWFVLDFEGEPARPVEERIAPASPLKDVTGMLRSFHYASRHALAERTRSEWPALLPLADAWDSHNRRAFLDGYASDPRIGDLLPGGATPAVMMAYELDKALYELDYELGHRPEWAFIPLDALGTLLQGESGLGAESAG